MILPSPSLAVSPRLVAVLAVVRWAFLTVHRRLIGVARWPSPSLAFTCCLLAVPRHLLAAPPPLVAAPRRASPSLSVGLAVPRRPSPSLAFPRRPSLYHRRASLAVPHRPTRLSLSANYSSPCLAFSSLCLAVSSLSLAVPSPSLALSSLSLAVAVPRSPPLAVSSSIAVPCSLLAVPRFPSLPLAVPRCLLLAVSHHLLAIPRGLLAVPCCHSPAIPRCFLAVSPRSLAVSLAVPRGPSPSPASLAVPRCLLVVVPRRPSSGFVAPFSLRHLSPSLDISYFPNSEALGFQSLNEAVWSQF